MGYYTDYELSILVDPNQDLVDDDSTIEMVKNYLKENDDILSCLEQQPTIPAYFCTSTSVKWYSHEEYMRKMSLAIQDVTFELRGRGEDDEDRWIKFFLNGKMQRSDGHISIKFDPFDPSKLE